MSGTPKFLDVIKFIDSSGIHWLQVLIFKKKKITEEGKKGGNTYIYFSQNLNDYM